MRTWLSWILTRCRWILQQCLSWLHWQARRRGPQTRAQTAPPRRVFAQPKPQWGKQRGRESFLIVQPESLS